MAGMRDKGPKQSSRVTRSSRKLFGQNMNLDGSDRDDADSAVWSEDSMYRGINFPGTQPHNERDGDSAVSSVDSMPRGADFSYTQQHNFRKCTAVLPELRVMMLGKTGSGKSASGNTILGKKAFRSEASALPVTKCCASKSGVVEGQNITVIDTPAITTRKAAWLSEKVDPGPHVFLLVIRLGRFTEEYGEQVKWIQSYFGEEALKFTIILFTGEDQLKGKPLQNFLHESSELQTLLDGVEGRYHVFNDNLPTDHDQVKGLIKKIENTLINKLGYAYTHEEQEKVKTAVRQEGTSWKLLMFLSVLMFLSILVFHCCYCPKDPVVIPELRVMMLGKTGSGKSASGNTILGREAFKSEASPLPVTKSCDSQSGVVEGRNITVIDTPAITTRKAAWLLEKVDPEPKVFLLVIPLGRYTEEDGEEVKWIQSNFGEEALKFTIILFTGRDQMDQINAEEFLNESSGLQTLVSGTGGGYHIFDNKNPRGRGQVKWLLKKIELLLRKNMGYSYSYGLQVKTAVREEEEMKRREEERERREKEEEGKRRGEEKKRRGNGEERRGEEEKRREEERERREEERERREEGRERREEEREIREKKRREEERKTRAEEEERKRREEERKRREEKRRAERTTEQSWNFGNILNGFIGFVLRVIMEKIWYS